MKRDAFFITKSEAGCAWRLAHGPLSGQAFFEMTKTRRILRKAVGNNAPCDED
jgi:hypothetical protein